MELVTVRQFAKQKGISYEAARKQVTKYTSELGGHIVVKDRTRFLDEEAVAFLTDRRRLSPIVTVVEDQSDEIKDLQGQVEDLKARLLATEEKLSNAQEEIARTQAARILDQQKIIQMQEDARLQIESQAVTDAARQVAEERVEEQRQEIEQLREEIGSFERSWFGLYRKRKS